MRRSFSHRICARLTLRYRTFCYPPFPAQELHFSFAPVDEPIFVIRDHALVRKRAQLEVWPFKSLFLESLYTSFIISVVWMIRLFPTPHTQMALSAFSLRHQCALERRVNRYFRLHYASRVFTQHSAMLMCEIQHVEKSFHQQKVDWFNLQPGDLRLYREDLVMVFADLSGGSSGFTEYLAHRKRGKRIMGVGWDPAALLAPPSSSASSAAAAGDNDESAAAAAWRQPAFGPGLKDPLTLLRAHPFDPAHLKALVTAIGDMSVRRCVPFVFADGCAPLSAAHAQLVADSLGNATPSQDEVADMARAAGVAWSATEAQTGNDESMASDSGAAGSASSSSSAQYSYATRSVDAREACAVAAAVDELVLRVSERAVLGQLIVMVQTLASSYARMSD